MVIMSNETFEKEMMTAEIYRKLLIAQRQINNNEGVDGESVLEKMREKYGYV